MSIHRLTRHRGVMMAPGENLMPEAALDPAIDIQQLECRFECGNKVQDRHSRQLDVVVIT
jgi:hypothetical protein